MTAEPNTDRSVGFSNLTGVWIGMSRGKPEGQRLSLKSHMNRRHLEVPRL